MLGNKEYSGLCLGGPKDGQYMMCKTTQFETIQTNKLRDSTYLTKDGDVPTSSISIGRVVYLYLPIFGYGFWVTEEDYVGARPPEVVMDQLMRGYRRP